MVAKRYKKRVYKYLGTNLSLYKREFSYSENKTMMSISGSKKKAEIKFEAIDDGVTFFLFLHEVGHYKCGHLGWLYKYSECGRVRINAELEAWEWAIKECKKLRFKITSKMKTKAEWCYQSYMDSYRGPREKVKPKLFFDYDATF